MLRRGTRILLPAIIILLQAVEAAAAEEILKPYDGPTLHSEHPGTLNGRVMTGYQGWFNCAGDGADLGWTHWAARRHEPFAPGNVSVDLWPDVSEFAEDELYETGFIHQDGTPAKVFSSHDRRTVIRHFKWMADYGIDGAFVQRFTHNLHNKAVLHHKNTVLASAREGANRHGRAYVVMYDLTSTPDNRIVSVFDDWRMLREKMHLTKDFAYQFHNGKPLVAIWGVGFNDRIKPRPDLEVCAELIRKFKAAGCSVMLGIPTGWRKQDRDALDDPRLHEVLLLADVLSPWAVGRFRDLPGVQRHATSYWKPDVAWTREQGVDYMPVIFPGFSRHNMRGDKLDAIPRLKGKFLWSQVVAAKEAGAQMLYVAMFDEVDEGTAIFKCTNNPPVGNGAEFLTYEELSSDYYLRLVKEAGRLLRNEIPATPNLPL